MSEVVLQVDQKLKDVVIHSPHKILHPEAIIFDWDHTLADSWSIIAAGINQVFTHFGREQWPVEKIRQECSRSLRDYFPQWFGDRWEEARDIYLDYYKSVHLQKIKLLHGAQELVQTLAQKSIPLFVVSNKFGPTLRSEAQHLGVSQYFKALVGSQDAEKDKPARETVDLALKSGGLRSGPNILFVGDSHLDVECGRAAGCTPIVVYDADLASRMHVNLYFPDCFALLKAFL